MSKLVKEQKIAVINGGFFSSNKSPEGLFISKGIELSKIREWNEGGILYVYKTLSNITPIIRVEKITQKDRIRFNQVNYAIQSKPLIIEDGKNGIYSSEGEKHNRLGIGFTWDDELIVCGAFTKDDRAIDLLALGNLLERLNQYGGPNIRLLLGLDGGPPAHLYIPSNNLHYGSSIDTYVPNTIHIFLNR